LKERKKKSKKVISDDREKKDEPTMADLNTTEVG
jgi:hypothetical protein